MFILDPGRIGLHSEALYCSRLLDVTSTDERLLNNPTRILQMSDEITNIQAQNWLCLKQDNLTTVSCPCVGDHLLSIVKVVCQCLLHGRCRDLLSDIAEAQEPNVHVKGTVCVNF